MSPVPQRFQEQDQGTPHHVNGWLQWVEGWHRVPTLPKRGSHCVAEQQVGQIQPAVPARQLWDQPEHFRGRGKNHLGLGRGEQSG